MSFVMTWTLECADKWICSWSIISDWNEITSLELGAYCVPGLLEQEKIYTMKRKEENNIWIWMEKMAEVNRTQTAITFVKKICLNYSKSMQTLLCVQTNRAHHGGKIILPFYLNLHTSILILITCTYILVLTILSTWMPSYSHLWQNVAYCECGNWNWNAENFSPEM